MRGAFLCFVVVTCGLFNYSSGDDTNSKLGTRFQDGDRSSVASVDSKLMRSLTRERPIWNPEISGVDKSGRHDRRRLKKHERRKERQERRERRKHRNHLQESRIPIAFPPDSSSYFNPKSSHSNNEDVVEPGLISPNNVVSEFGWLETNLTSIWLTLQYIQRDIKQLRRQLRINNQIKANKGSQRGLSTHELCPPDWAEEPGACTDPQGLICGGKGKCSCGQCICEQPYYGIHCHCNDMICSSSDGVLCGGAGRGQCRCGACVCRPEFTGSDCGCSLSTSECKKENGEICNGNGECICNRCHCQDGFTGTFCDELIYSASVCERLKPCVLCIAYGKKSPRCEDCNINVEIVEELASSRATCIMVNLGCILKYAYILPEDEGDKMTVLVSRDRSCP